MTTKEKKIKNIASELIPKELRMNLLNLISDICVDEQDDFQYDFNGEIKKHFEIIKGFVSELNDIIMVPLEKRNDFSEKLKKEKKELVEIGKCISNYNSINVILLDWANQEKAIREFKKNDDFNSHKFDFSAIKNDCFDFIFDDDINEFEVSKRKSQILSCLPLRMTKDKYNDYMKNALNNLLLGDSITIADNILERLKFLLNPFKAEYFDEKFALTSDKLLEIFKMDFEKCTDDELDEVLETLDDSFTAILDIEEKVKSLYNDINYMMNITLFCVDEDYLYDEDIMFKDLYFTTKNIIKSKSDEVFIDDVLERIYGEIEKMFDEVFSMKENFYEILDMIDTEKLPDDIYTYVMTEINIDENFDKDISNEFINFYDETDSKEVLSDELRKQKIDEFIEYVKIAFEGVPNKKAKKLKGKLFDVLICSIDDDEYEKYLDFVFEGMETMENIMIYLSNLSNLFEREDFEVDDDDEFDCDCGHDHHHHDHECSCGHDHHHHH